MLVIIIQPNERLDFTIAPSFGSRLKSAETCRAYAPLICRMPHPLVHLARHRHKRHAIVRCVHETQHMHVHVHMRGYHPQHGWHAGHPRESVRHRRYDFSRANSAIAVEVVLHGHHRISV